MTGIQIKQFISRTFNIPQSKLRAESGKHFCGVRIVPEKHRNFTDRFVYSYQFTPELGNRCMRIIYAGHESLSQQCWGGNVGSTSIAMSHQEWVELMRQYGVNGGPVATTGSAGTQQVEGN